VAPVEAAQGVIVAGAVLLLSGCMATFADYDPPAVSSPVTSRPTLAVEVVEESYLGDASGGWSKTGWLSAHGGEVRRALEASGRVQLVDARSQPALQARVVVQRYQSSMAEALLHLLTAFLVPVTTERQIAVELTLVRGEEEVQASRRFAFRVWHDLLLIPVYPWGSPARLERELVRGLTLECASEALFAVERR
jgi:hypothetical protein